MLLFDMGKVCRTKIFSFNNDKGLSLVDKTKDYVNRNAGGRVELLHKVTQLG